MSATRTRTHTFSPLTAGGHPLSLTPGPLSLGRYSTDYVFDGGATGLPKGPYGEADAPAPLNVYGSSKLAGETSVLAADPSALVIRTNVVFGPETAGKNFVYQLARKLKAGEAMNVPTDQVNTPTYSRDLAEASVLLVEKEASGIFNVGGSDPLDRLAFGCMVVGELSGLNWHSLDASHLKGVTTSNSGQAAKRPLASGLRLDKTLALLPSWRPRSVGAALKNWKENPRGKPLGE